VDYLAAIWLQIYSKEKMMRLAQKSGKTIQKYSKSFLNFNRTSLIGVKSFKNFNFND
jgi:hypothetical protein